MGLLNAAQLAIRGVAADQWLEYFNCDALAENVLAIKAKKWVNSRGTVNPGNDNVISNGSKIAVADGQFVLIVEQGRILDFCGEPGEYTFDMGTEPSLLGGGPFNDNARGALLNTWERFRFGGMPGKDTRVYYFNTKELIGNKYGTPGPVPFRVVDANIGLDVDVSIRFYGQYSYRISDPLLFYTQVTGNFPTAYTRDQIDGHLKAEVLAALQPAVAKVSAKGIRYSALPGHSAELADAVNEVLSPRWRSLRGLEIASFSLASVNASPEDEQMIKELQRMAVLRDPSMAAARLVGAQSTALESAAANESGAMLGFMGLGLAQGATGPIDAGSLYALGQQQRAAAGDPKATSQQAAAPATPDAAQPGWACSCGAVGVGRFCAECGSSKPADAPRYRCDKCGWVPPDPTKPTKFCQECGDPFDDNDLV